MEQTLGKRIVSHRKRLGLTQDQLAEQLGITAQAVSKWEHDQSCPDITMLPHLAEIFGITIDALLGMEKEIIHEAEIVIPEKEQEPEGIHIAKGDFTLEFGSSRRETLSLASLVLLVGGLMLAGHFLQWEVSFWGLLWPSAFLVYGLVALFPKFGFVPLGSVLLGGFFLANELELLPPVLKKGIVFPLLLLLFGLSLLVSSLRKPNKHQIHIHSDKERTETFQTGKTDFLCETTFGEDHRYITLSRLTGGRADCSFGDLTVDLSGCEEVAEDCQITVDCSFGQITLLLPRSFRGQLSTDTTFASVSVNGDPDSNATPICIHCEAAFGAIIIRYV